MISVVIEQREQVIRSVRVQIRDGNAQFLVVGIAWLVLFGINKARRIRVRPFRAHRLATILITEL